MGYPVSLKKETVPRSDKGDDYPGVLSLKRSRNNREEYPFTTDIRLSLQLKLFAYRHDIPILHSLDHAVFRGSQSFAPVSFLTKIIEAFWMVRMERHA